MTNANCISTISGQELLASGNAPPKRRYLIFSLLAVLAFVSIHPWKKTESASKSEIKRSADYTDYAD